ncbi:MAG: hypothetical protein OIN86_12930 [Candidatus Methanoperedens sp.]|nr:hypothetical protein [Candidatus Methanoperedens sp.]CAG0948578.1 hypothetical protein METP1_00039 [Methanosarcinales archaeon]
MTTICEYCGKPFTSYNLAIVHLRFCSVKRIKDDEIADLMKYPRSERSVEID